MTKKVALVTGSTSGIGFGIAKTLAREGYDIHVHGFHPHSQDEVKRIAAALRAEHEVEVAIASHDLGNIGEGGALIAETLAHFGQIDVLVNNAGVQFVSPVADFPLEEWQRILAINLTSAFTTIRAALPAMRAAGRGRIINIASVHGTVASSGKAAYVAAKHGLIGLTKTVALETARDGITCNAICPGWVRTPLVETQIAARAAKNGMTVPEAALALLAEKQPNGEFVSTEEIGSLVNFLASDAGRSITGAVLAVDGGWTAQ